MAAGKVDQLAVRFHTGIAAGGHVGIIGPHQLHARQVSVLQFFEIGLPAIVFVQIIVDHLSTEYLAERGIGRIAWIRHQHLVSRIDKGESDMQYTFLAAYQGLHLTGGVYLHAVPSVVEVCHSLPQFHRTHRGLVAVGRRVMSHLAEFVDGLGRRRLVGAAYRKTYDILSFSIESCHFLEFPTEVIFLYRVQAAGWFNVVHILRLFVVL